MDKIKRYYSSNGQKIKNNQVIVTPGSLDKLESKLEEVTRYLDDGIRIIEDIDSWAKAYPEKVFPEPEPKDVKKVCDSMGITLDSLSAMVLRGFVKEWGNKASIFLQSIASKNK